jgi:hypothetical protein
MIGKKRDKEGEATAEADGKSNGQPRLYGFRGVYVFDISQTEGKELPTLTEVNGDVSGSDSPCFRSGTWQPMSARSYANFFPQLRHTSYVHPDSVNGRLRSRCQQPKTNSKARCRFSATMRYQQFAFRSRRSAFFFNLLALLLPH